MGRLSRRNEGVSPIIATILLVAISLVLIGMIFIWVTQMIQVPKEAAPEMSIAISVENDEESTVFKILVRDIDEEPTLNNIEYKVYDKGGNLIERMRADSAVYGNLAHMATHEDELLGVGFSDNDADGRLSVGDYFLVQQYFSKKYSDRIDISEGIMTLIYSPTGTAMEDISFAF